MKMFRTFAFVASMAATALALAGMPVEAQWQTPNHSVPIGRGAGITGFGNAAPGTSGLPFVSNGPVTDPSFQVLTGAGIGSNTVANSNLVNMPAATFKGSILGGAPADLTVAQTSALLSVANQFTTDHTIAPTDCNTIVQMGSGSTWPLTLTNNTTGFTPPCPITIMGQASRGVKLSGFGGMGLTSPNILWPQKSFSMKIDAGVWKLTGDDGRWAKQNLTINIDSGGSDSNDGLATGTTNAIQHLDACRNIAQNYIDTQSAGNGGVTCLVPAGQTFQEFVQVFFPLTGGGTLIYQGNGGVFTWQPPNSSFALQFGDLAVVGATNVTFSSVGVTTPQGLILGHNYGIIDFNAGVSFIGNSANMFAVTCDFDTHFNFNNGFTVSGSFKSLMGTSACKNALYNFNNGIVFSGTPTFSTGAAAGIFTAYSGTKMAMAGNVTFSGAITAGARNFFLSGNSVLDNASGNANIPGSVAAVIQANSTYCDGGTTPASPC